MKYYLKRYICLLIGFIMSLSGLIAQTDYESEDDMIKAANKMFENSEYSKVMPLYSQLVSLYPKKSQYNM